ncbi:hypothetical protein [Nocardia sp. NPDC057440]|uniref:hypothetical protein n=1 Tax=Nocardia sp. NPDC057440 TaxID=3346134 RepID=UPI00366AAC58
MSEAYTVHAEYRFADGEVLRVGDLWRDRGGSIRDTYRVKAIRNYRRSGLQVVVDIIRRERDGQVTEPGTETQWPVAALFDGRIVRDGGDS